MFSDDGQSVGHSTSWHLATGTHNTLTTPLIYPPDRVDVIITMSQLRSLRAGERPESRVASVAHPRLPEVKCWTRPSQSLGNQAECHLAITSERGRDPGCPLMSSAGGARRRLRPYSLSFLTVPPFCVAVVLEALRETACRVKAHSGLQVLGSGLTVMF